MRKVYFTQLFRALGCWLISVSLHAQTDSINSSRRILTDWDPIRGAWLDASFTALHKGEPIPDRTFPEDLTPYQMYRAMPQTIRNSYDASIRSAAEQGNEVERARAQRISAIGDRMNCSPEQARSYGDPHLNSFDGATYSFQTVGEFVLAKSAENKFEVQTRQEPQRDDFSLNTAIAMNVAGDRVCIYANEKPDGDAASALRVNGRSVTIGNGSYFLDHGGTISYSGNTYRINWPTGETVQAEMRRGSDMNFINVSVQIYPCAQSDMSGLLGNANRIANDDFDGGASNRTMASFSTFGNSTMQQASNEMEKEYLAFMARNLARNFRITQETSLFDYAPGRNTISYTDERFPKVHRTVADLSPDRQQQARKVCEDQGVRGDDLKGCIFYKAYLEIPPSPRPDLKDQLDRVQLTTIERPRPNVNPQHPNYDPLGKKTDAPGPSVTPQTLSKPVQTQEMKPVDTKPNSVDIPVNRPVNTSPSPAPKPGTPSAPAKPSTPGSPSAPGKPSAPVKVGKGK
jgi:hypothetical protein